MKRKKILVVGTEFHNQGAYLMLVATLDEIRCRLNADPVLEHTVGTRAEKASVGAKSLLPYKLISNVGNRQLLRFVSFLLRAVSPKDISAVLDASGFRYGDQWKGLDLVGSAKRLRFFADMGVPVYVLPQAFGPFEETAESAQELLRASTILYARDPISQKYISAFNESGSRATEPFVSPDFTGPVQGSFPTKFEHLRGSVPIIPNWNILERASTPELASQYTQNLAGIVELLRSQGLGVYGLSHEGEKDAAVLESVASIVEGGLPVVRGLNGVELKGLIGTAPLVVSGRYHAISSALSQGVPVLAHGWSHKYQWLLADYGVPGLLVDPYAEFSEQLKIVKHVLEDSSVSDNIKRFKPEVSSKIEAMWDRIAADFADSRVV